MKELIQQLDKATADIERLKSLQNPVAGVTSVTATAPVASSGGATPNISLAVTTTNDGGAVALQTTGPNAQTGSARLSVSVGADTRFLLNTVPILESGTTFPTSGLVDGQRYRHMTYRSWFVYNSTDSLWRQEAPGSFGSSFPTVAAGDNTVAPKIKVWRVDRGFEYYWDGTRWLSTFTSKFAFAPFAHFVNAITVSDGAAIRTTGLDINYGFYIENLYVTFVVYTTHNTSNSWNIVVNKTNAAATGAVIGTLSTAAGSRTNNVLYQVPLVVNTAYLVTDIIRLFIDFNIAVGAPGTLEINGLSVTYRLVG